MKVRTDLSRVDMFFIGVQKGARCRSKCLLEGRKGTKAYALPVEKSFIGLQKDKRVHDAG